MSEHAQFAQPPAKLSVEKNSRGYTYGAVVYQQPAETDQAFRKRLDAHMQYLKTVYDTEATSQGA